MLMRQEDHPRAGVRRDQPGAGRGAWNSTRPTSLTSPGQSLPRGSPISFPGPLWEHLVGPEAIPPPLGEAKWQRWSQVLSKSDTLTNQEPHLLDQLSLHNRQKAGAHQLGPGPSGGSSPRPLEHGALQRVCAGGSFLWLTTPRPVTRGSSGCGAGMWGWAKAARRPHEPPGLKHGAAAASCNLAPEPKSYCPFRSDSFTTGPSGRVPGANSNLCRGLFSLLEL